MWTPSNVISAHHPASPRTMLEGNKATQQSLCALLPQLLFNDMPLILCGVDSMSNYVCWVFRPSDVGAISPVTRCFCILWGHCPISEPEVESWANEGLRVACSAFFFFCSPSIPSCTAALHTVRRRRTRWRSTGMSHHLVLNTSLPCSTKPCKVTHPRFSSWMHIEGVTCFGV